MGHSTESGRNVPYDKWGPEKDREQIRDENGDLIGVIHDEIRYVQEEDIRPVTLKDVLADIDAYRQDDGTYGDDDISISLAYEDGTFVDVNALNGKRYKKKGIVGAHIGTPDYEMVYGGEMRNGSLRPWQTWSEDGESGHSNSYSGYKATGAYRVRIRTTFNNLDDRGRYRTKHEIIRRSAVKALQ